MDAVKPGEYQIRFRHLDGDIGPFPFSSTSSVADMKNSCWDGWPSEGAIKEKKPQALAQLRVMYQGKILENTKTIKDLERLPGEMVPGKVLTLHLIVSQPGTGKAAGAKETSTSGARPGCCSVQ